MYAHENPFRVERILTLRYRLQVGTWDGLLDRFESLGRRVCILGEEGHGKTTLMEDLCPHLHSRGYRPILRLHSGTTPRPDWRELRALGPSDVLLIDGADLLARLTWWRLRRMSGRWGGLIAASHWRPLLPPLLICETSAELLQELLNEVEPVDSEAEQQTLAQELFARHHGNLRDALREMYDRRSMTRQ